MTDFRIGQHDEAIKNLVLDMTDMKEFARETRDFMAERRGERKVGMWLFSVASGAFGALLALVGSFVTRKM